MSTTYEDGLSDSFSSRERLLYQPCERTGQPASVIRFVRPLQNGQCALGIIVIHGRYLETNLYYIGTILCYIVSRVCTRDNAAPYTRGNNEYHYSMCAGSFFPDTPRVSATATAEQTQLLQAVVCARISDDLCRGIGRACIAAYYYI